MRDRPDPDALSPRARARLRGRAPAADQAGEVLGEAPGKRVGWVPVVPRPSPAPRRAPWVRLPASLASARWQPGRAAVLGVALVTVLAVLVLGLRVAWARSSDGDVVAPGGGARAGPSGLSAGAAGVGVPSSAAAPSAAAPGDGSDPSATVGAAGAAGAVVVVHVVGQVREPGVRRLPVGSRVADAVEAAGGATRGADLSGLNLARLLVDGEQVRVPKPGEVVVDGGPPGGGTGAPPGGSAAGGDGRVSLSSADLSALDALPGIGPVLAQRIVDWRTEHGRFTSVDELGEVSGIGEKLLDRLRPLVVP